MQISVEEMCEMLGLKDVEIFSLKKKVSSMTKELEDLKTLIESIKNPKEEPDHAD